MKDIELVGCEELFEDIFILLQDMLHQHVSFFDQSANGLLVPAGSKPAVVLEDLYRFGVAEKIAEEPKLPDRLIRHAGVDVGRLHSFVDDRPPIPAFEHPSNLALVILTRLEPTFPHRLLQLRVWACIGQRVGQSIAHVAWRHHSPTVLVRFALSELVAIGKLRTQHK